MTPRVFAIVPAAGRSRRMGRDKQLLDVGGRPMLAAVVESLLASRVAGVVVVTRRTIVDRLLASDPALAASCQRHPSHGAQPPPAGTDRPHGAQPPPAGTDRPHGAGAPPLQRWGHESTARLVLASNEDADTEMIDSIRIGLRTWRDRATLHDRDGLLVCPGDHPGITVADIDTCVAAFQRDPERIVVATHDGRRGHPLIFPISLTPFVESSECNGGLRVLPRTHADQVQLVECRSTGVTRDIDTPRDYEDLP